MKSKEFIQVLRKIIQEEVQTAVRTEFNRARTSITESTTETPVHVKASKISEKRKYSENSMLNDILNETGTFSRNSLNESMSSEFDEWPTVSMNTLLNNRVASKPAVPLTDLEGRPVTNIPKEVVNNITKDYSALMKAIDRKKGIS